MKLNAILSIFKILLAIYIVLLVLLYFFQEKLIFHPTKLPQKHVFKFNNEFKEINIKVANEVRVNTLLFKSKNTKGVVLFFHGNGGTIHGWGHGAGLYLQNNYDILYVDYRGYGKSDGTIINEKQLIDDAQKTYDYLKEIYQEENIIISGTSIGTGIATQIATNNHPQQLILISPYASLESLIKEKIKIVPGFLMKYKLRTIDYLKNANLPITIFHGDIDQLIPCHHSHQLKQNSSKIELHILKGVGHNNIPQHPIYITTINRLLSD